MTHPTEKKPPSGEQRWDMASLRCIADSLFIFVDVHPKAEATGHQGDRLPVLTNFGDVTRASIATVHGIDCATAVYCFSGQASRYDCASDRSSTHTEGPIPVVFSPWDKPELIDNLLICFGAVALAQVSGIWASAGVLIYGTGYRRKLIKTNQHFARVYPVLEAVRKVHEASIAPPVVLNRHCSTCDFQPQCRQLAIDQDDLTLLRGMTEKERSKIKRKGISTITLMGAVDVSEMDILGYDAASTIVSSGRTFTISAGQTSTGIVVYNGGTLNVLSGGIECGPGRQDGIEKQNKIWVVHRSARSFHGGVAIRAATTNSSATAPPTSS
jgi:autotransporter passenger strand-loop-strand repeat protein